MSLSETAKLVAQKFWKNNQTLGLAESCTGGLISASITSIPGVSSFYLGGVVSYANEVKHDLLSVSNNILKKHGAVSKQAVVAMARGAKRRLKTDWVVSVSGIAGPAGGHRTKPVGLVFVAVVGPNVEVASRRVFKGTRQGIQKQAAEHALLLLLKNLTVA